MPDIKDVSPAVEAGEFLELVGPNGSDKPTLLALLLGLLEPDTETVWLFSDPSTPF